MLNANHPVDERLSALVSQESDALADAPLANHVASCERCTAIVDELGALRAHLAALPDVPPARPLRLVPDVTGGVDRLGSYVRRVFGPAMAAGAALTVVGLIGTASPAVFQGAVPAGGEAASAEDVDQERASEHQVTELFSARASTPVANAPGAGGQDEPGTTAFEPDDASEDTAAIETGVERSPWPMVLFTGIALLIAAALLRWIVVPRAG